MALSLLTPWQSSAPLDPAKARARFRGGAYTDAQVDQFLAALYHHAETTGMAAAALAGQVAKETGSFRYGGQVRPEQFNFAGVGSTNDGAAGHSFGSIDGGVKGLIAHHGNYLFGPLDRWPPAWGPYKALAIRNAQVLAAGYGGVVKVIGDYTNKRWAWTPSIPEGSLANGYARGIVDIGNTLLGGTTVGHVPQPPWTDHPITKQIGIGRDPDAQRVPKFVVNHSMGGTLKGTDGYFPRPEVAALTDFGIGQVDAGGGFAQIIRWNDPHGKQIGWASGPVKVPEGDGPRILALFGGAAGLNRFGVSIEHDDTTKAGGGTGTPGSQPVSAPQWSATCWLQAFIHAEWLHQTAATFDYNAWHREFCGAAYKTCPNPRITDHVAAYQAAVKAIMAHYQEGAAYPAGGLVINGLRLATPPEGGTTPVEGGDVKEPKAGTFQTYINAARETITVVNYGGEAKAVQGTNIVDAGISVTGMDNATYDRSVKANQVKEWAKRP